MEYKYYRELKHNYLIVKNENEDTPKNVRYQTKMLERGNLSGFISCDLRTINNEDYLYYEINSMQSLKDRFSAKGMSAFELRGLFEALKNALEGLSEYLLGIENVILDVRSVFVDLATSEYRFMYCPFAKEQADFSGFVDELFELVDHEDDEAVEMIYACSEKMQIESTLVIDCLSQILERESRAVDDARNTYVQEDTKELLEESEDSFEEDYEEESIAAKPVKKKTQVTRLDGKVQLIFGFLFIQNKFTNLFS